ESNQEAILKRHRIIPLFLIPILFSSLTATTAYGQNQLLRELAKEDQDQRRGKKIERTDEERVNSVLSLIGQGEVKTPEDKFNAALVLQHTLMTFREKRLVGTSPDNYLLAHYLFKSALEADYQDARYLVAASIDRYLMSTEGRQKYGTQRVINQETGKEELVPIDRKTPNSERAKYSGVDLHGLQAAALLSLKLYSQTFNISLVLFAVYDLVTGYLIIESRFVPRPLGMFLVLAGVGWLTFVWPPAAIALASLILPFGALAEIVVMLGLLIKGVDVSAWDQAERACNPGDRQSQRRPTTGCTGAGAAKARRCIQRRRAGPVNLFVIRTIK